MSDWDQDPELAKVPPGLPDAPPDPRCAVQSDELTPEQVYLINDMIHAWIEPEKKAEFRQAFRNDCKRLLATGTRTVAQAVPGPDGYNGCYRQAIAALNYLAQYPRPSGGQSHFNAEHLLQIADEMKRSRTSPVPSADCGGARQ